MNARMWCVILAALVVSCDAPPAGPAIAPQLDMYLKTSDGRQIRYDVARSGRLRFSGGRDLLLDNWSWTGSVTTSQGAALQRIVSQPGWASSVHSDGQEVGNAWQITLRDGSGRHSFEVTGNTPGIDAAWAILNEAGRARLQEDLDRLPRPDIDRLVERRRGEQAAQAEDRD